MPDVPDSQWNTSLYGEALIRGVRVEVVGHVDMGQPAEPRISWLELRRAADLGDVDLDADFSCTEYAGPVPYDTSYFRGTAETPLARFSDLQLTLALPRVAATRSLPILIGSSPGIPLPQLPVCTADGLRTQHTAKGARVTEREIVTALETLRVDPLTARVQAREFMQWAADMNAADAAGGGGDDEDNGDDNGGGGGGGSGGGGDDGDGDGAVGNDGRVLWSRFIKEFVRMRFFQVLRHLVPAFGETHIWPNGVGLSNGTDSDGLPASAVDGLVSKQELLSKLKPFLGAKTAARQLATVAKYKAKKLRGVQRQGSGGSGGSSGTAQPRLGGLRADVAGGNDTDAWFTVKSLVYIFHHYLNTQSPVTSILAVQDKVHVSPRATSRRLGKEKGEKDKKESKRKKKKK